MMRVSVQAGTCDLPAEDLQLMRQIGIDCLDFSNGASFPGVAEQGYPDLDPLLRLKRRIRDAGMEMNRVTLPDVPAAFMRGEDASEELIEPVCLALKVFAEAKLPIARLRLSGDIMPNRTVAYKAVHRGGAIARGERAMDQRGFELSDPQALQRWWRQFDLVYERLAPIADDYGIKLAIHPSDTPYPGVPFDSIGMHRIMDHHPSRNIGFIYCVGTRGEAGGTPLVLDEIHQFGRKERIFLVHLRNIRGSLATAGAFEEAMLDDGDINMPKVLFALRKVGFNGCLNPDHMLKLTEGPKAESHPNGGWRNNRVSWSYSVGYIKGLLAAMDEFI